MPAKCFECGEMGHIAGDCPQKLYAIDLKDTKPLWCGQCDRITRLATMATDDGEKLIRCRNCHPKGNELPPTYMKCTGCRHAIYAWDVRSECGQHQAVGKHLEHATPAKD